MEIKLKKLILRNFKGIREFVFEPNSSVTEVRGDNEAGKTTLLDAYLWLWTGKDSLNQANFPIKTINKRTGEALHGLEHEVEGEFEFDGIPCTLRRALKEKWVKQKGSAKKIFTGHTTDYFINGVPVPEKGYHARLVSIVPEEMFKLLSDLRYFPVTLHWEKRRGILMDAFGEMTDEEIMASDPKLAQLAELLKGNTVEQFKKVLKAQKNKVDDRLEEIPVRISEAERTLPDTNGLSKEEITKTLERIREVVREKEKELVQLQQGGGVAPKMNQLQEIQAEMNQIKVGCEQNHQQILLKKQQEFNQLSGQIVLTKTSISNLKDHIRMNLDEIERLEKRRQELREIFHIQNKLEFTYSSEKICPTCGQNLPEKQVEAARQKALEEFNQRKAQRLEEIREEGTAKRKEIERLQDENKNLAARLQEEEDRLVEFKSRSTTMEKDIQKTQMKGYLLPQNYYDLEAQADQIKQEIAALKAGQDTTEQQVVIRQEIVSWNAQADELSQNLAAIEQAKVIRNRIKDLESEQQKLAAEYEQLEKQLWLCEEFDRQKASLLEEQVNSKFKLAKFRMFNHLINGGIDPCCEITYNGVPWDGLNSGHRIIVALDIIDTLAGHYRTRVPIFVDNAESVTDLPAIESQLIKLIKPDIQTSEDRKKYSKLVVA